MARYGLFDKSLSPRGMFDAEVVPTGLFDKELIEATKTPATPVFEDSDNWWSGAQRSFASVALASVLAITASATAIASTMVRDVEEIPAGNLSTIPEDDSWKPPTFNRQSMYVQLPLGDPEEIPAGNLSTVPEDDSWSPPVLNQGRLWQALPIGVDEDVPLTPVVTFIPDEDVGAPTIPYRSPWLITGAFPETDEYQHVTADEEAWINPIQPAAAWQKQPVSDDEIPAGSLYGQYDEDFWQNPVAPVPWKLWQPLPLYDPEEIPAATLVGQPDEDLWTSGVAHKPLVMAWVQQFTLDQSEVPPQPTQIAEEDYWNNPTAPVSGKLWQRLPYLPDPDEIPAGRLSTIPEDDSWSAPVIIKSPLAWPQQWTFDQDEVAIFAIDEDGWQPRAWPVRTQAPALIADDDIVTSSRALDEDGWQPKPWALAPQRASVIAIEDDYVHPAQDEDYWYRPTKMMVPVTFMPTFIVDDFVRAATGGASLVIWIGEDID